MMQSKNQEELKDGEDSILNKYKDYTKVFTPPKIADYMVQLAELYDNASVLEPSAGLGSILWAIHRNSHRISWVDYYELNETHATQIFLSMPNARFKGHDFLADNNIPKYDRIIANPPMDEDKWLIHIPKMYKCLASNGILVTLAPQSLIQNTGESIKNSTILRIPALNEFKEKMKEVRAERFPIDNWYTNKDGSKTPIHIIKIRRQSN